MNYEYDLLSFAFTNCKLIPNEQTIQWIFAFILFNLIPFGARNEKWEIHKHTHARARAYTERERDTRVHIRLFNVVSVVIAAVDAIGVGFASSVTAEHSNSNI